MILKKVVINWVLWNIRHPQLIIVNNWVHIINLHSIQQFRNKELIIILLNPHIQMYSSNFHQRYLKKKVNIIIKTMRAHVDQGCIGSMSPRNTYWIIRINKNFYLWKIIKMHFNLYVKDHLLKFLIMMLRKA